MQSYRIAAVALTLAVILNCAESGPVRSIALVAQRASKIPRSIRAPFRNTEMMTARGFGKRSSLVMPGKQHDLDWNYGKRETKFFDDAANDVNDNFEQALSEQPSESFPIDWVANELTTNTGLLKAILYRFVDDNKDGYLSAHEFLKRPNDSNNIY